MFYINYYTHYTSIPLIIFSNDLALLYSFTWNPWLTQLTRNSLHVILTLGILYIMHLVNIPLTPLPTTTP